MKNVMIITGGSRGIGAATARLAAARDYAVCVNYLVSRKFAVYFTDRQRPTADQYRSFTAGS